MQLHATLGRCAHGARSVMLALVLVALIAGVALTSPARADSAGDFVTRINAERTAPSRGLPALAVSADLTAAAQRQANAMASAGKIFHTPNLGGTLCCWSAVGENVGYGGDVGTIHTMFMNSGPHKKNILDTSYSQVGVGVATANGLLYVAEVFRMPKAGAPANPPAPKASTTPKASSAPPAPKVTPTPKATPTPKKVPTPPATPLVSTSPAAADAPGATAGLPSTLDTLRDLLSLFLAQPASLPGVDPVTRGLDFAAAVGSTNG